MNIQGQIGKTTYESAPTIKNLQPPHADIHHSDRDIYILHEDAGGLGLDDRVEGNENPNQNLQTAKTKTDLTIEIRSEDGSHTEFYQDDEESILKIMRLLITPRLFTQPLLTLASQTSVSTFPTRTIDLILVRVPTTPLMLLPPGWLDVVEVEAVAFHDETAFKVGGKAGDESVLKEAEEAVSYVEIHTTGDWMVTLKLRTAIQATVQDQRQLLARVFELPLFPFRLETGGVGIINPSKISRLTVFPAFDGIAETGLPADLLRCIR